MRRRQPRSTLFPYTTLFRSLGELVDAFNRMLERIDVRERELSRANEELRREIADRRRAEQERAELLVREREANRLKDEFLARSEEHTSELQSRQYLVCRLLL